MARMPAVPPPSPERDKLIALLKQIWLAKREMWRTCASVRPTARAYELGVFNGMLFLEDDSRFNFWFRDLLATLRIPWDEIE